MRAQQWLLVIAALHAGVALNPNCAMAQSPPKPQQTALSADAVWRMLSQIIALQGPQLSLGNVERISDQQFVEDRSVDPKYGREYLSLNPTYLLRFHESAILHEGGGENGTKEWLWRKGINFFWRGEPPSTNITDPEAPIGACISRERVAQTLSEQGWILDGYFTAREQPYFVFVRHDGDLVLIFQRKNQCLIGVDLEFDDPKA